MNPTEEEIRSGFDIQGARNIFLAKKKIMAGYRFAQELGKDRPVHTEHGSSGESLLREWLSGFLPAKYGITSGYVISTLYTSRQTIRHYDVIIYDKVNSPILWRDTSNGEERLAIPAEHTLAVFEVKSSFNTRSTKDAIEKLKELRPLWAAVDPPSERYKKYFPARFFCATVFFEFSKNALYSPTAANNLNWSSNEGRYFGGLVIEASEVNDAISTQIQPLTSDVPRENDIGRGRQRINSGLVTSKTILSDGENRGIGYYTGTNIFTQFAFDVLALLEGTYEPGRASSFHGLRFGIQEIL